MRKDEKEDDGGGDEDAWEGLPALINNQVANDYGVIDRLQARDTSWTPEMVLQDMRPLHDRKGDRLTLPMNVITMDTISK